MRGKATTARFKCGKKLDMGKSCVRFKTVEDLPLDVIGQAIARHSLEEWVSLYRLSRTKARTSRQTRVSRGTRAGATRAPR
jgi:hypothetical protein